MNKNIVTILLPKGQKEDYYKFKFVELMRLIMNKYKDSIKFEQKGEMMKLIIKNGFSSPEKLLEFLVEFSKEISSLMKTKTESSTVL